MSTPLTTRLKYLILNLETYIKQVSGTDYCTMLFTGAYTRILTALGYMTHIPAVTAKECIEPYGGLRNLLPSNLRTIRALVGC